MSAHAPTRTGPSASPSWLVLLMAPYVAWVGFTAALDAAIWHLN